MRVVGFIPQAPFIRKILDHIARRFHPLKFPRYGVASVWLGKVCRLLNVPVPPRGYWAAGR